MTTESPGLVPPVLKKFMMAIRVDMYALLEREAVKREVTVQELLRAVILPDWVKKNTREAIEWGKRQDGDRQITELTGE